MGDPKFPKTYKTAEKAMRGDGTLYEVLGSQVLRWEAPKHEVGDTGSPFTLALSRQILRLYHTESLIHHHME